MARSDPPASKMKEKEDQDKIDKEKEEMIFFFSQSQKHNSTNHVKKTKQSFSCLANYYSVIPAYACTELDRMSHIIHFDDIKSKCKYYLI